MLHSAPAEKEWLSWLFVVLWALIIFITVPFARSIQAFVQEQWSRDAFTYIVVALALLGGVGSMAFLLQQKVSTLSNYAWLTGTAIVFIWYTFQLRRAPEEALHFVEYGILGVLIYRALTHRIRDISIYFSAAIIGTIIGTIDEVIQWITPKRFWGYKDIWLNFFAVSLVQLGIAKGLRPSLISNRVDQVNLRVFVRLSIVASGLLTLSLLNTPARVAWYAERIPGLAFLKNNPSTMSEYGYLYKDPEIGVFRSRLSPDVLSLQDRTRGREAAEILDEYKDNRMYEAFLDKYTPYSDPFLHEAKVHLFRRDRYLRSSEKHRDDVDEHARRITIAYRENKIMERYFPYTLRYSSYVLAPDLVATMEDYQRADQAYESAVSKHLITQLNERQMIIIVLFGLLIVVLIARVSVREKRR